MLKKAFADGIRVPEQGEAGGYWSRLDQKLKTFSF
jgi:hypothetical protein